MIGQHLVIGGDDLRRSLSNGLGEAWFSQEGALNRPVLQGLDHLRKGHIGQVHIFQTKTMLVEESVDRCAGSRARRGNGDLETFEICRPAVSSRVHQVFTHHQRSCAAARRRGALVRYDAHPHTTVDRVEETSCDAPAPHIQIPRCEGGDHASGRIEADEVHPDIFLREISALVRDEETHIGERIGDAHIDAQRLGHGGARRSADQGRQA